jgi:hypothetical protein
MLKARVLIGPASFLLLRHVSQIIAFNAVFIGSAAVHRRLAGNQSKFNPTPDASLLPSISPALAGQLIIPGMRRVSTNSHPANLTRVR